MKDVAGHIAQCTGSKIPPSTPVPRVINLVERTFFCRSDKEVPIEGLRYSMSLFRNHKSLRPDGTVGKRFYLSHLPYLPVRDPVDYLANARAGRPLITHAGGHFVIIRQASQQVRLVHAVFKRLW